MSIRNSSPALRPFTRGASLPYHHSDGVLVTGATSKVEWGSPCNRSSSRHLIKSIALAWVTPDQAVVGAIWLCGRTSIGVDVFDPEKWRDLVKAEQPLDAYLCPKCIAVRDGKHGPCVYRVYDKSGERLLYIGSTVDWDQRREQHRQSTWWWPLAKTVDREYHSTVEQARKAEVAAIRRERPRMNVAHNRESAS